MARTLVVLSGAGMSAESGVKTFRDTNGLWEDHDVMDVASPEGWARDPALVLDFYNQRRRQMRAVQPNAGHEALAALEDLFTVHVVTQNIDDLHERAGSSNVLHLHGEIFRARSSGDPGWSVPWTEDITPGQCCPAGHPLRPDVVWFGETVPRMEDAARLALAADLFLVVGTSLAVYPAASLIHYVRPEVPKFLLDPHLPPVHGVANLDQRAQTAAVGLPALAAEWRARFAG